jgi:hypothetical protein
VPPRWQPSLDHYIDIAAHLLVADRAARRGASSHHARRVRAARALCVVRRHRGVPRARRASGGPLEHLAKNHPLPDANKRAAFLLTARFLDANGLQWGPPDVETDAGLVERVAASEATHDEVVAWIRGRTREMECPDEKAEGPRRLP